MTPYVLPASAAGAVRDLAALNAAGRLKFANGAPLVDGAPIAVSPRARAAMLAAVEKRRRRVEKAARARPAASPR